MKDIDNFIYEYNDVISIEEDMCGNKEVHFLGFACYGDECKPSDDNCYIEEYRKFYLSIKQITKYIKKFGEKGYGIIVDEYYENGGRLHDRYVNPEDVKNFYTDGNGHMLPEIRPEDIDKKTPVGKYIVC